jgi:hypothetical protein
MQATKDDWARGYARQALADLRAREVLVRAGAEKCHRLHFLQMAAEKTCKAHLIQGGNDVKNRHAYVASNLPVLARHFYSMIHGDNEISQWELSEIKRLASEIEVLAPACDHGDFRKDNSEYPWENAKGEICIPCEYSFPNINDGDRAIVRLIKLIRTASESYSVVQPKK